MTELDLQPAPDVEGASDVRRALIFGGVLALLPLICFGVLLAVFIGPQGKDPKTLVGSSRVDLQACKLEYSIVSPK